METASQAWIRTVFNTYRTQLLLSVKKEAVLNKELVPDDESTVNAERDQQRYFYAALGDPA